MNQQGDMEMLDITTDHEVVVVLFKQPSIGGMGDVETIADTLRRLVLVQKPCKMVIDFSKVSFFSSQVLGLLVDLWRRLKDTGGALRISGINPQLTRVFRITHLDKLFEFYDDAPAAVAALRAL
ncbi:MAG: STAS domain-containing protein [Planctomycetales bacterium]|nr:STAS domain-containing protein [Planctomycetales bacterium]